MKKAFKKLTAIVGVLLSLLFALAFAGCAAGIGRGDGSLGAFSPSGGGGTADFPYAPSGGSMGDSAAEGGKFEIVLPDPEKPSGSQTAIAKQLTAAAWNDALNYEFWLGLFEKDVVIQGQEGEEPTAQNAIFYEYASAPRGLDSSNMHAVDVVSGGKAVAGAKVVLCRGTDVVYSAVSDSAGRAYVFGEGTAIEAVSGEYRASVPVSDGVTKIELTDFAARESELEIMLVVDTTGSMGDELSFLCDELAGVVTRISSALNCKIRLGLLFYRDTKDEYLTRKFDFVDVTSESGLNTVVTTIKAQKSSGGGDYPEAVDTALAEAVAMNWNENSKTKLLFHVLDAPYHDEQENQSKFAGAVKSAAEKGIRVIPVAASGLDTLGQYTMRSAALLTGGTYAFLTDDSGIGDSHVLPVVGEYTVEYLSDLMVRLSTGYYTGTFQDAVDWRQAEKTA